jgi:carbon monoxide dehydrogenase subunit G
MELKGEYSLAAAKDDIWAALNDPDLLAACLPGCEFVERITDGEMRAAIAVEVGGLKTRISGTISVSDPHLPHRWTLSGEGRGRPSGSARGTLSVELVGDGGRTTVSYLGSAKVGGKLAEVAQSAIERYARDMAEEFFARLAEELDKSSDQWVDQLDHSPAAVQLGDEPSEDVVVDKVEIAGETADRIEERLELAAGRQVLGGPYSWGLFALVVLIIILAAATY